MSLHHKNIELLRAALDVALVSLEKGNLPFGCLLADANGNILERGENTVVTDKDSIAHCEINLVHQLAGKYETDFLAGCTVYAGTEPCPMCAAAIFWSGIGRIVFALDKSSYHNIAGTSNPAHIFDLSSDEVLQHGGRKVMVEGPALKEEATDFYRRIYI